MSNFTYVLSYDATSSNFSLNRLRAFIESNRLVKSWYLPFQGTYVLKSDSLLMDFLPSFNQFFDGSTFLITYANGNIVTGSLPVNIWHWMNTGDVPQLAGPLS